MFNNVKRANVQTKRISHTFCVALLYTKKKKRKTTHSMDDQRACIDVNHPTDRRRNVINRTLHFIGVSALNARTLLIAGAQQSALHFGG